jgi:hypothetical protein
MKLFTWSALRLLVFAQKPVFLLCICHQITAKVRNKKKLERWDMRLMRAHFQNDISSIHSFISMSWHAWPECKLAKYLFKRFLLVRRSKIGSAKCCVTIHNLSNDSFIQPRFHTEISASTWTVVIVINLDMVKIWLRRFGQIVGHFGGIF